MKIRCTICGRRVTVKPSNIKDIDNYHCTRSECRSEFMKRMYGNPETKPVWDWTMQNKIVEAGRRIQAKKQVDGIYRK